MISRRSAALIFCVLAGLSCASTDRLDLIVANGWIPDGGDPRVRGDVDVRGDRIVAVGDPASLGADYRVSSGIEVRWRGFRRAPWAG
jgi:hypothetical protein